MSAARASVPGKLGCAVGVALKWVPHRYEVDPLDGTVRSAGRAYGAGEADHAALELALRFAEEWDGSVTAVCAGPPEADGLLREALALGARKAFRVEIPSAHEAVGALAPGSANLVAATAAGLAWALAACEVVVCGDYSGDGGSGAVPGLLAARKGAAQGLGLVGVEAQDEPGVVLAERRLDGGRRERLRVRAPMVLSVEAGAAHPRRASLAGMLEVRDTPVPVLVAEPPEPGPALRTEPYRPRAKARPGPDVRLGPRERVLALVAAGEDREPPRVVHAEPAEAAREILDQLRRWGYL